MIRQRGTNYSATRRVTGRKSDARFDTSLPASNNLVMESEPSAVAEMRPVR